MGAAPLLYDPTSSNPDEAGTPERRFCYYHNKRLRVDATVAATN